MFYFWFHTAFIKKNYFCLRKRDLEVACKDTNCKHFSQGFKIELFFKPKDENQSNVNELKAVMGNCGKCNVSIIADEPSVIIEDIIYHWECLSCDKCGKNFTGAKNCVIKDNKPVCERCEGEHFFSSCQSCNRNLTTQRNAQIGEYSWHIDCFRCSFCSKLLNYKKPATFVLSNEGVVFCPEHKDKIIGSDAKKQKCSSKLCIKPATLSYISDMLYIFGNYFHEECFKCIECNRKLNSVEDDFFEKDENPCCKSHENPVYCYGCSETIKVANQCVTSFNENWHFNCLRCYEDNCDIIYSSSSNAEEMAEMKQGKLICKQHNFLSCYNCKQKIQPNELLQFNDHDLHFYCFTCGTCGEVISNPNDEKSYFLIDSIPHCNKHKQICTRCSKLIQPNDLIKAKGTPWHKNCFTCQLPSCKLPLQAEQYVIIKGKNFCSSHPQCTRCCNPIENNDKYEDHNGIFHKNCYKCGKCNCNIDPENSAFLGNRLLCKPCHPAPKCFRCTGILEGGHIVVGKQHYHEDCFCCSSCGNLFASPTDPTAVDDHGLPICNLCVKPKYICKNCNEGIFDQVLETLGFSFHTTCFTCELCKTQLGGSFALLDDHILCKTCSASVQKSKCESCKSVSSFIVQTKKKPTTFYFNWQFFNFFFIYFSYFLEIILLFKVIFIIKIVFLVVFVLFLLKFLIDKQLLLLLLLPVVLVLQVELVNQIILPDLFQTQQDLLLLLNLNFQQRELLRYKELIVLLEIKEIVDLQKLYLLLVEIVQQAIIILLDHAE